MRSLRLSRCLLFLLLSTISSLSVLAQNGEPQKPFKVADEPGVGTVHKSPLTLKDYPLPIGKTPLFVGGNGILTEEIDGELMARIYPVTDVGETVFYSRDGETRSRITLENPDWDQLSVIDLTANRDVPVTFKRHACEFRLEPGHDYIIK